MPNVLGKTGTGMAQTSVPPVPNPPPIPGPHFPKPPDWWPPWLGWSSPLPPIGPEGSTGYRDQHPTIHTPNPPPYPPHSPLAQKVAEDLIGGRLDSGNIWSTYQAQMPLLRAAQQLVQSAKRGKLEFTGQPQAEGGNSVEAMLRHLDLLGEQRKATPKGPERKAVKREIRQTIRHPGRT